VSILPACLKEEVRPAWTKDGKEEELEEQWARNCLEGAATSMVVWFGKGEQRGGQVGERARVNVNACCQNTVKYGSYTNENTYTVKHVVLPYWCVFILARCQVPLAIFAVHTP
jgi:hypothetical protein